MSLVLLAFSIMLLVFGHWFKARRWKKLISIFEDTDTARLLNIMAASQVVNIILPFRGGDLLRVWLAGRRELRNGYILAFSSVAVDIFIDTVTVGFAFITLYVFGIHQDIVRKMAISYGCLSIAALMLSGIAIRKKKSVKSVVWRMASFFNEKIERQILMASYTVFASIKDIFRKQNLRNIIGLSVCVWNCYFLSYDLFAFFLQRIGYEFTLTKVFQTIFSMAGGGLLIACLETTQETDGLFWICVYLFIPAIVVFLATLISGKGKVRGRSCKKSRFILPQMNAADRLQFLNIYFNEENRQYFEAYLELNGDVSVVQDCSAGSNATTILCMKDGETFYRKYAFGADADKLHGQILWLEDHMEMLPLPPVLNKRYETHGYCCYDMPYHADAMGFFQYIHTSPLEGSWQILLDLLKKIEATLCSRPEKRAGSVERYIDAKILPNIQICERWGGDPHNYLYEFPFLVINGKKYPNLSHYTRILSKEFLLEVFGGDRVSELHGDLTIENIIVRHGQRWYLIDPNPGNIHETVFLDYAKILQSLHGNYEFLNMVQNIRVTRNRIDFLFTGSIAYKELYGKFKRYLYDHFSGEDVRSIYFHEAAHWLRLMPYKIKKDPERAVIFYAGMLIVLADIKEMFVDGGKEQTSDI